jgi:Fe-S cluster biogenesis protein NfuA
MENDKEFEQKVRRIGGLVHELESITDPAARASARELMQLLLDLHAQGIDRMLDVVAHNQEHGQSIIDDLGADPLVSSLLVLYGLHPLDLESRVARAIEKVRPKVFKHGAEIQSVAVEDGVVHLRVQVAGHSCGSTAATLRTLLEDAMYEAAPDMASLALEGLEEPIGSNGFVPLEKLATMNVLASERT